MIGRLLSLLTRVLLETALLLIVFGVLLLVLGVRVGRRLLVDRPDRLEKASGLALRGLQLLPQRPGNLAATATTEGKEETE